jgi:hypothetical protein
MMSAIIASLEQQSNLLSAQASLIDAIGASRTLTVSLEVDELDRQIADRQATGGSTTKLEQEKSRLQLKVIDEQIRAQNESQAIARRQLELELQREAVTARIAVKEAEIAELKAKQARLEAQGNLRKAVIGGDTEEIAQAQIGLDVANQGVDLAQQQTAIQRDNQATTGEIANARRQTLGIQQGNEIRSLDSQRETTRRDAIRGGARGIGGRRERPVQLETGGSGFGASSGGGSTGGTISSRTISSRTIGVRTIGGGGSSMGGGIDPARVARGGLSAEDYLSANPGFAVQRGANDQRSLSLGDLDEFGEITAEAAERLKTFADAATNAATVQETDTAAVEGTALTQFDEILARTAGETLPPFNEQLNLFGTALQTLTAPITDRATAESTLAGAVTDAAGNLTHFAGAVQSAISILSSIGNATRRDVGGTLLRLLLQPAG